MIASDGTRQKELSTTRHRLVQLTDPHIGGRPDYQLLGLDTGRTLDDVLRAIEREQPQTELLLATGDISANGAEAAYERFVRKMRGVSLSAPWFWLPGNHDRSERMREVAPANCAELIELGAWRLLLLDTSVEGQICGGLTEAQLERFATLLRECRGQPVMVLMHHQPVPVGSNWIDGHMLKEGAAQLLELVVAAGNVKALVWGHVHQQFDGELEGIGLHATPSTSVQFTPGSGPFSVDDKLPGYRWFDLCDDGSYRTGVERVQVSEYNVDLSSAGY
ncbi:metallophosphoesterase [Microbulbifer yueqingensis]|uniref:Icc protein n=1 Tax=Microbulbifer yueqingensis TaxID=658219 RepID=A0A1G8YAB6_9GAMM|nr:metallophosphoesterase [Microbulbifer yueqingensis]SDJ99623.1 Icc protein [Microbulbifer yueqingensis]